MNFLSANPGVDIFGLHIAWYGVIIATGMLAATVLATKTCKYRNLKTDNILGVALLAIPLSIIGARIYFIAFSGRSYTFLEAIQIWNGGMAIYGGIIGGALGVLIYCFFKKKNFFDFADVLVPSLILGQCIGRWGNFVNQEAFGPVVTNPNLQWFPFSVYIDALSEWHYATFFYESFWNLLGFVALIVMLVKFKQRGVVTAGYFIIYGIGRALIETLRTDSLFIGNSGLRVSQLLSIILVVVGIGMLVYIWIKHKKEPKAEK